MERSTRIRKLVRGILIAGSLFASYPAHTGGGITGGALEITQLANNAELMAQVAEATQQTVHQINMLTTMLQNLKDLANLNFIAQQLGIDLGPLRDFIRAYNGVKGALNQLEQIQRSLSRMADNSMSMSYFFRQAMNDLMTATGGQGTITAEQLNRSLMALDEARRQEAEEALQRRVEMIEQMQQDYQFIQNNAREIRSITGNVQGLQFLATQNTNLQRLLLDTKMSIDLFAAEIRKDRLHQIQQEEDYRGRALNQLQNRFYIHGF